MKVLKNVFISFVCVVGFIALTNAKAQSLSSPLSESVSKAVIDLVYPVGSVFLDGNGSLTPPGQGVDGIKWAEQTNAKGHLLVGSSQDGDWVVGAGLVAGTLQSTDPHQLSIAEMPKHNHVAGTSKDDKTTAVFGGVATGVRGVADQETGMSGYDYHAYTSFSGGDQPHSHTLKQLQRYGVKVWKRVS
jgi:hypothetical protein